MSDYNQEIINYKESLRKNGELLFLENFPKKIKELNDLIESPMFKERDPADFRIELNVPKPTEMPSNNNSKNNNNNNNNTIIKKTDNVDGNAKVSSVDFDDTTDKSAGGDSPVEDVQLPQEQEQQTQEQYVITDYKVKLDPTGMINDNHVLNDIVKVLRPYYTQLSDDVNAVKMWITVTIPKRSDGNNFGVQVQEETLNKVDYMETKAFKFLNLFVRSSLIRAKAVSKVAKYPYIQDYRNYVMELDENQFISLRYSIKEVRDCYVILHDIIMKNLEKIKVPRNSNTQSLY